MSYGFEMMFKQCVSKEEAFNIALSTTNEYFNQAKKVIQENIYYFPSIQRGGNSEYKLADEWFLVKLFSLNFVWWEDKKLLGLSNDSNLFKPFFDTSFYFQNSTDQDYALSEWDETICVFKKMKTKVQKATEDELFEIGKEYNDWFTLEDIQEDVEYYRKTLLYDIIYNELRLNSWLYDKEDKEFEQFTLCGINSMEKRLKANTILEEVKKKL